jgi:hypothetical protein
LRVIKISGLPERLAKGYKKPAIIFKLKNEKIFFGNLLSLYMAMK